MKSLVEQIYNLVPHLDCKGKCQESCGPIDMSDREKAIIKEFCEKNNIPYFDIPPLTVERYIRDLAKTDKELVCPFLKDDKCSIYSVRPLICRLWGTIEAMPCLWGCKPTRYLNNKEGHQLLKRLEKP